MKNTKWFIQDTNLREDQILKEVNILSDKKIKWQTFGIFRENNDITGIYDEDFEQAILRCGIKVLRILTQKEDNNLTLSLFNKLKNGISYNPEKFDQSFYTKNINLPFLNMSGNILEINNKEDLYIWYSKDMFIKPTDDQKCFAADTLPAGQTLSVFLENRNIPFNVISKEKILINSIIDIKGEYRFICLKDEIIGHSKYFESGKLDISGLIPKKIMDAANDFCKAYNPSDIYTMDLCELTDGSIKIVEYNCWNCCGLYNINKDILFSKINEYYQS